MSTQVFHRDRAMQHAPKTREEIARAARELSDAGYSNHTVASILKVSVEAVKQMLGPMRS